MGRGPVHYFETTQGIPNAMIHNDIVYSSILSIRWVPLQVVQVAFGIINAALAQETKNGVLVHCWGGVNRSAACVVAFLTTQCLGDPAACRRCSGGKTAFALSENGGTHKNIAI